MSDGLTKLGEAARRARAAISPWQYISPRDVAGFVPGGGIVDAAKPYKEGLQKTAEATKAFREGRYGDAARWYGSGVLDTGTAALSALPEGGALTKLAMAIMPKVGNMADAVEAAKRAGDWDPRDFYHGSTQAFDNFDFSKATAGNYGKGVYVSAMPDKASSYAKGDGGSVYPVQIRRQNPLDMTTKEGQSIFDEAVAAVGRDNVHEELVKRGFDSIKAPGETVILNPDNIRMKFAGE